MRSYRRFLMETLNTLADTIRVMENDEWHHMTADSQELTTYAKVGECAMEVAERLKYYDDIKASKARRPFVPQGPEESNGVV